MIKVLEENGGVSTAAIPKDQTKNGVEARKGEGENTNEPSSAALNKDKDNNKITTKENAPVKKKKSDTKPESQPRLEFTKHEFIAAARTDSTKFLAYATQKPTWLLESDKNGWLPLHEAVRAGKTESVSIILSLVEDKDHVNARMGTDKKKYAHNAMWIAEKYYDKDHPMIKVLKENGGVNMAPIRSEF